MLFFRYLGAEFIDISTAVSLSGSAALLAASPAASYLRISAC